MPDDPKDKDYSPEDTVARRDKVLGIMLRTPPQPHDPTPRSRVQNRKKADARQPDPDPETPDRGA